MSSSCLSPPNTPSPARVRIDRDLVRQDERFPARASNHVPLTPPTSPPTAPPKNRSIAAVKAMAGAAPMGPEALKESLGLDIGKCGSNTLKNRPCRNPNPSNIDKQIISMTTLTQASPELLVQLGVLAELALCIHHIKSVPKAARIRDWKKAFPVGDEKAVPIEPIEDQIKSVLDCFPYISEYTCLGKNRNGMQCGNKIGGKRTRRGKKTVALILKPEHYSNHHNLTFLLNVLASNMFCYHHKEQIPDRVAEWELRITTIYRAHPMQDRTLGSTGNTRFSRKFQGNPAEFWDDADDTSAFVTEIEKSRPSDYKACYSLVRDKMKEPLKKEELNPGHVYVYEVEGNKGFVKIGFTTQTIEDRSEQWKFQCDRVPKVLYPLGPTEKIPHANRVEGLCLAELKYRNVIVICEACPKQHIEWVQVPAAEAIAVIQKWTKWIKTRPFKDVERPLTRWQLANGITSWTLRDEEVQRTADMPKFMQEIAAASSSAGHQQSKREASAPVPAGNLNSRREIAVASSSARDQRLIREVLAALSIESQNLRRKTAVDSPSVGHQHSKREASVPVSARSQSSKREIAIGSPSAGHQHSKREASVPVSAGNLNSRRETAVASTSAGHQRLTREALAASSLENQSSRKDIAVASPSAGHQRLTREALTALFMESQNSRREIAVASPSAGHQRSKREASAVVSAGHQRLTKEALAILSAGNLASKRNNTVSSSRVEQVLSKIFDY